MSTELSIAVATGTMIGGTSIWLFWRTVMFVGRQIVPSASISGRLPSAPSGTRDPFLALLVLLALGGIAIAAP